MYTHKQPLLGDAAGGWGIRSWDLVRLFYVDSPIPNAYFGGASPLLTNESGRNDGKRHFYLMKVSCA